MTGLLCMRDWSEDRPYFQVGNDKWISTKSTEEEIPWIANTTSAIIKFWYKFAMKFWWSLKIHISYHTYYTTAIQIFEWKKVEYVDIKPINFLSLKTVCIIEF